MSAFLVALALAVPPSHSPGLAPRPAAPPEWVGPPGSSKPFLTRTLRGELLLSWLERLPDRRFAVRVATTAAGRWTTPVTVVESDHLFVNWADFPSVVETSDGAWVVHWLEKSAAKSYAYDIRLSISRNRGGRWTPPMTLNRDGTATEHGFVSMVPGSDGSVTLAWLDGRQMVDSGGAMSVRTARLDRSGRLGPETVLDARTCECCQVSMAAARTGLVATYRNRSDDEVRDIAIVRQVGAKWTDPRTVAEDHWVWKACPVNGPSVSARGDEVGVAWFTAAGGTPMVKVAFSSDGGSTFGPPVRADNGNTLGRIHFQLTDPGLGALVWLETEGSEGVWMVRAVRAAGAGTATRLASVGADRNAGFPRTAILGDSLWVAYVEPGHDPASSERVKVRKLAIPR